MYRIILAMAIIFFNARADAPDAAELAHTIEILREQQRKASPGQSEWYDQEIERIKKECGVQQTAPYRHTTWLEWLQEMVRSVPFIVLQLFFLSLLAVIVATLFVAWWFVSLIALLGLLIQSQHEWRSQKIKIITVPQALLYVGPDARCPVQKTIPYLDEVTLLSSRHSKTHPEWRYVTYKDIKGWIRYDAIS